MTWCCELVDLTNFVSNSKPREVFKYCTGCSVQDTLLSKEIGKIAYEYSARGLVYLYQKRSIEYYFDFDHFLIKASPIPAYSLIPFADDKLEQLRRQRGVRNYDPNQRTNQIRVKLNYPV